MLPMFYNQLTAVSTAAHTDLNIEITDYRFAGSANIIPVGISEFGQLLSHYPIVFIKADSGYTPVAVVGTEAGHNQFVNDEGEWLAPYLPAYVRRYPFTVASVSEQSQNLTICIDETYPGCNREGRGNALFNEDKSQSGYLQTISQFLQQFELDFRRNRIFTEKLVELDLLESTEATFTAQGEEKGRKLDGFFVVNRERLKQLDPSALQELNKTGALELIYLHLASLSCFSNLFNLSLSDR
ncbi:SapC protein [Amphritea atlantica]|uniref:SapC protein n=1 Tax=Amphritea atlantica TaxID=355243 RepID=A0A1H9MCV4_9GAMM|nr:SapC family protein [Amphritea atlantica]SER21518.1 SapC protein [Amphritea atlantica]